MNADTAYAEWQDSLYALDPHDSRTAFLAGYKRALQDAADAQYRFADDPRLQRLIEADGLVHAYRFGCMLEGVPDSACACPGVCTGVFEVTHERLEQERNEAAAQAIQDTLADWQQSGITHPSQIRAWLRDRAAAVGVTGDTGNRCTHGTDLRFRCEDCEGWTDMGGDTGGNDEC